MGEVQNCIWHIERESGVNMVGACPSIMFFVSVLDVD